MIFIILFYLSAVTVAISLMLVIQSVAAPGENQYTVVTRSKANILLYTLLLATSFTLLVINTSRVIENF